MMDEGNVFNHEMIYRYKYFLDEMKRCFEKGNEFLLSEYRIVIFEEFYNLIQGEK